MKHSISLVDDSRWNGGEGSDCNFKMSHVPNEQKGQASLKADEGKAVNQSGSTHGTEVSLFLLGLTVKCSGMCPKPCGTSYFACLLTEFNFDFILKSPKDWCVAPGSAGDKQSPAVSRSGRDPSGASQVRPLIDETLNATGRGAFFSAQLSNSFLSGSPARCIVCIWRPARQACAPAMCCVRLSGETEATCAASPHVADSRKVTLSGGAPIRRYHKRTCCSLGLSNVQQHLMGPPPPAGI